MPPPFRWYRIFFKVILNVFISDRFVVINFIYFSSPLQQLLWCRIFKKSRAFLKFSNRKWLATRFLSFDTHNCDTTVTEHDSQESKKKSDDVTVWTSNSIPVLYIPSLSSPIFFSYLKKKIKFNSIFQKIKKRRRYFGEPRLLKTVAGAQQSASSSVMVRKRRRRIRRRTGFFIIICVSLLLCLTTGPVRNSSFFSFLGSLFRRPENLFCLSE